MKKTAFYNERKTYVKYDDGHAVLYLNEQPAEQANEETGETVFGFTYTGDQPDGGTLIEARGVTDENRRDKFVAGLIGHYFDIDAQIAILANGTDTPEHAAEFEQFSQVRTQCKAEVDELLARTV